MSITITIQSSTSWEARQEMLGLLRTTEAELPRVPVNAPLDFTPVVEDGVTAGEIVDALHGALKADTATEDADGVEFPAAATEPPKKRGRPRKEAPVVDADTVVTEGAGDVRDEIETAAADSGQIDIEDAIADSMADEAPQPEDPAAGWTTQDARNAGRALLDRAPDVDTGNRKLAATLVPFGVQQVKALQPGQIEAFVVATQKAVF